MTTTRWWTDPDTAVALLPLVGGDDVMQGVGTAVLGMHALMAAPLRELAKSTLVHIDDVENAVLTVPLEEVSKTLAAAVEPIMAESAPAYGAMLADELREQAATAARAAVGALVAKGLSWPQAITRVAEIVGVNADGAQGFIAKAAAPAMPPDVLADAADRALMTWAARIGDRESHPYDSMEELPKSVDDVLDEIEKASKHRFAEEDHPRGEDGEFVRVKQDGTKELEADQRAARAERLTRRRGRLLRLTEATRRAQAVDETVETTQVAPVARGQKSLVEAKRELVAQEQQLAQRTGRLVPKAKAEAEDKKLSPAWVGHRFRGRLHQLVPASAISRDLFFNGSNIKGKDIARLMHDASEELPDASAGALKGNFIFIVDDPYLSDFPNTKHGGFDLDPNIDYELVTTPDPADIAMKDAFGVQIYRLRPKGPLSKSWEPKEHPRDEDGQFTAARGRLVRVEQPEQTSTDRQNRRERRAARQRRLNTVTAQRQAQGEAEVKQAQARLVQRGEAQLQRRSAELVQRRAQLVPRAEEVDASRDAMIFTPESFAAFFQFTADDWYLEDGIDLDTVGDTFGVFKPPTTIPEADALQATYPAGMEEHWSPEAPTVVVATPDVMRRLRAGQAAGLRIQHADESRHVLEVVDTRASGLR